MPNSRRSLALPLLIAALSIWPLAAVAAQPGADHELIEKLTRAGVDMSVSHLIEFHFHFAAKENAARMVKALQDKGFDTVLEESAKDSRWMVFASKTMVPIEADLAFLRNDFRKYLKAFMGVYDGCGADVSK